MAEKTLTLVVPVFDAPDLVQRLLARLPELETAAGEAGFSLIETLLVDDGSHPPLAQALRDLPPRVAVLANPHNCGKGYSVRRGALTARGNWVLMSDADLSTPFAEFPRLAARADAWMVCGSRHGRRGTPYLRQFLSRIFNLLVTLRGIHGIHDTQCGFKLFRMDVMRPLFRTQRIRRFAFDVELIQRVQRAGGTIEETPVLWQGGRRSSLRILRDAPRMLWDLIRIG